MIQLPNATIPQDVLNKLKTYQDEIDALPTFAEKRAKAKSSFKSKNKRGNKTFDAVKIGLTEMCSGARRCVYCEDSVADEVEHFRPKDAFPESCFVWDNYVYACGNCNSPKSNRFAVFRADNGDDYKVELNVGVEPPTGEDAVINPRIEDPLNYCILDLSGTFNFEIHPELTDKKKIFKADYTFNQLLRLNGITEKDKKLSEEESRKIKNREFLRIARKEAYGDYKARLKEYNCEKKGKCDQKTLDNMIEGIKQKQHPTVWKEMQRHFHEGWLKKINHYELHALFEESPEALNW
jgi:uncharacterized protein (TIGR02646 family)